MYKIGHLVSNKVRKKISVSKLGKYRFTDQERFWPKVKKTNSCWNWIANLYRDGYGQFNIPIKGIAKRRKIIRAHRFSWELHFGKIPKGMLICHHCDNRKCINPEHLFLGTIKDNARDCTLKGRRPHLNHQGENNNSAKLTNADIVTIINLKRNKTAEYIAKFFPVTKETIYN